MASPTVAWPFPNLSSPLSGKIRKPRPPAANVSGFAHKEIVKVLYMGESREATGTISLKPAVSLLTFLCVFV